MKAGIYEIVNTVNGKRYIGSAVDFLARWALHRHDLRKGKHHSRRLQNAWNKYGEEAFAFRRLIVCAPVGLLAFEQRAIDALHPDYNICKTAGNRLGVKCSMEARERMRQSALGQRHSDEHRRKNSEGHKGMYFSPEHRAKISAAKLGKKRSPECVAKMAAANKGKKLSAETRAKIGAASKGHIKSAATRAKLATANLGKKASAEARASMAAAQRRRFERERAARG